MSKSPYIGLCLAALIAAGSSLEACTGLRLAAFDGSTVHGRTLEFGIKVDTDIIVIPRGYHFTATTPNGKGLEYDAKYATVGTICFGNLNIMDGMNEKGLSVGTFYFDGFATYVQTTNDNQAHSLSPIDFPNWIVTQFATLDEVKAALNKVVIAPTSVPAWGGGAPPFHYVVYDKDGKSIAIEPIDGKLIVRDNPLGSFSNSPPLDWHYANLRNYIHLTADNVPPVSLEGVTFAPFGQGSGLMGLPGDFTPPSRFVRATLFSAEASQPANSQEAVFQTFHILNQFDIPVGVARQTHNGVTYSDYTQATVVHNPAESKYYFRTYDDQTIKLVNLEAFDKQAKEIKKASTSGRQPYVDVSKELKPIGAKS